jgi:hypothetical protein
MSVNSFKLSFLQISPKVWADKNHLYARTSKYYRFLNLFFYSRTVVVDRIKKHIEISIKTFWFFTSKKHIAFNDIKYIDIERLEVTNNIRLMTPTHDSETWYVQVNRKSSPNPEYLFRFVGSGALYGDWDNITSFINVEGMQYEKALRYAELVSKYSESQLWKDRKIEYNFNVNRYKCLKCGHISASKMKCIYCGGQEMENMS